MLPTSKNSIFGQATNTAVTVYFQLVSGVWKSVTTNNANAKLLTKKVLSIKQNYNSRFLRARFVPTIYYFNWKSIKLYEQDELKVQFHLDFNWIFFLARVFHILKIIIPFKIPE